MLISKFDLYKPAWLELVFDDRNKAYGAYELRQHYARNMVMAMTITFFGVALLAGASIILKAAPSGYRAIPVPIPNVIPVLPPPTKPIKKIEQPVKIKAPKAQPPAKPITMVKFVPLVVVDKLPEPPPKISDLSGAIGAETKKGPAGPINIPEKPPGPEGGPIKDNNEILPATAGLDVMPEPVGGASAWAKFLNKNLNFPYAAREEGASGRVILSFVIEKNGSLSNITVERAAGHGFDEEALRVLKLAKAWKPGMQNGQPVRVRYDIPISFQAVESN